MRYNTSMTSRKYGSKCFNDRGTQQSNHFMPYTYMTVKLLDKEKLSTICGLPVCLTTIPADDLEGWHDAFGEGKLLPLIIHNKWFIANNILLFSCFIGLLMDAEYNSVSNLAYSLPYFFYLICHQLLNWDTCMSTKQQNLHPTHEGGAPHCPQRGPGPTQSEWPGHWQVLIHYEWSNSY